MTKIGQFLLLGGEKSGSVASAVTRVSLCLWNVSNILKPCPRDQAEWRDKTAVVSSLNDAFSQNHIFKKKVKENKYTSQKYSQWQSVA